MQKLLIVSDSHGLTTELQMIRERHNLTHNIHCGDSELNNNEPFIKDFLTVEGNCDIPGEFNVEETLLIDNLNIYVTHGHLYRVKSTLLPLTYRAAEVEADIVCFGHSHVAGAKKIDERIYINPGSIRMPRKRTNKTYVIVSWESHDYIKVEFFDINGQIIDDLSTIFSLT